MKSWSNIRQATDMEKTAGQGYQQDLQGLLDMYRHLRENLGTETKGDILDIHCGCETHSYLCCHCMVAQS
jgi:hypothetical protein